LLEERVAYLEAKLQEYKNIIAHLVNGEGSANKLFDMIRGQISGLHSEVGEAILDLARRQLRLLERVEHLELTLFPDARGDFAAMTKIVGPDDGPVNNPLDQRPT